MPLTRSPRSYPRLRTARAGKLAAALAFGLICSIYLSAGFTEETPPAPEGFTRFEIEGAERESRVFSDYLWRHFKNRLGNPVTVFNKEYLTVADLWLAEARDGSGRLIQDVHRDALGSIRIDPDGYVQTHQHFSHALDNGWPFPTWTQAHDAPGSLQRNAVGWHFQERDKVPGWAGDALRAWRTELWAGPKAAESWTLHRAVSQGIQNGRWVIESDGPMPQLTTPKGVSWLADQSPYMQLRWTSPNWPASQPPPVAWLYWFREGDKPLTSGGPDWPSFDHTRRMAIYPESTVLSGGGLWHSTLELWKHPKWTGRIAAARIDFPTTPGMTGSDGKPIRFEIDSFFSSYDTRHTINNPILILAAYQQFSWTGDRDFLRSNIDKLRLALRHDQQEMGGLELKRIRNRWPGHDGLAGWVRNPDGGKTFRPGHGIGSNYWDLLPFGWDDFYATMQYYAATLKMADLEEAISDHPEWGIPRGPLALDPKELRRHAEDVKKTANELFWLEPAGRFAACVDVEGKTHDYGFTFLNLEAIWYGIASDERAARIMSWINGDRIIEGDTSTGADIYHWRFGPRATTLRNIEWYGQGWTAPESIPWGGQVQDGGAVLGFSFYDLWARLHTLGPDNAWARLKEIADWEEEVKGAGGYRAYYDGGKRGTTLQGCNTAGGIGVDCEFFESSLLPAIIVFGFAGLDPKPDALRVAPKLPTGISSLTIRNFYYRGTKMDVKVEPGSVTLTMDYQSDDIRLETSKGNGSATFATGAVVKTTRTFTIPPKKSKQ